MKIKAFVILLSLFVTIVGCRESVYLGDFNWFTLERKPIDKVEFCLDMPVFAMSLDSSRLFFKDGYQSRELYKIESGVHKAYRSEYQGGQLFEVDTFIFVDSQKVFVRSSAYLPNNLVEPLSKSLTICSLVGGDTIVFELYGDVGLIKPTDQTSPSFRIQKYKRYLKMWRVYFAKGESLVEKSWEGSFEGEPRYIREHPVCDKRRFFLNVFYRIFLH